METDSARKKRAHLLVFIFLLALVVASLDRTGHFLKLYWGLWWFDIVMHYLGGLLVGLGSGWFYAYVYRRDFGDLILFALFSALAVGIFWEIYELYIGILPTTEPYPLDTSIDLVMDLLGALTAGLFVKRYLSNNKNNV